MIILISLADNSIKLPSIPSSEDFDLEGRRSVARNKAKYKLRSKRRVYLDVE